MIDCRTCIHWDEFDSEVTHMRRVDDPSEPEFGIDFEFQKEVSRIATCAKGLSPMEDGKTVGHTVERCRAYFPVPVQIELPMKIDDPVPVQIELPMKIDDGETRLK